MRFIAANCLREGMQLAKPLYRNNDVMLSRGIVLTEQYITSIQRFGFSGIYIEDDLSADIEVASLISDELRIETTKNLNRIITLAQTESGPRTKMPDIRMQLEDIVAELCSNRNVMVNMMDLSCYDDYTSSHSINVAVLSIVLGVAAGLSRQDLVGLGAGALLHDIGKVYIDKRILNKNGPLTDEEFEIVKAHPKRGYEYIATRYTFPLRHCYTILDHHEKFDGTGYPNKKQGNEISKFGRITAIADVYDALTSSRPYRSEAVPCFEAVEYIMANSGTQFDPKLTHIFTQRIAPYPVGTSVLLSNGWVGLVIENYISFSLRPKLRIYQDHGVEITPFDISLRDDFQYLNVTIVGVPK